METEEVLAERGKKYGNYLKQCEISQTIKRAIFGGHNIIMKADQIDCLEMICVKISRIINGDPNYSDNWRDISGYAALVADRLDGKERE